MLTFVDLLSCFNCHHAELWCTFVVLLILLLLFIFCCQVFEPFDLSVTEMLASVKLEVISIKYIMLSDSVITLIFIEYFNFIIFSSVID